MYVDFPFDDVLEEAKRIIEDTGATVYFKFTCENCKSRQTFDTPNVLYTTGRCEECGHVTDLRKYGCNYLVLVEGC